ncbi:hypothetical protein D3C71_1688460 [compost metagenome]
MPKLIRLLRYLSECSRLISIMARAGSLDVDEIASIEPAVSLVDDVIGPILSILILPTISRAFAVSLSYPGIMDATTINTLPFFKASVTPSEVVGASLLIRPSWKNRCVKSRFDI